MPVLGSAAAMMWCDIEQAADAEFEEWHNREHIMERLSIDGFLRGSRWKSVDGRPSYFVMYEFKDHDVFSSNAYMNRLNSPTDWTRRMNPAIHNMVRSGCNVVTSLGIGHGTFMMTVRFSPSAGEAHGLHAWMLERLIPDLHGSRGVNAVHFLQYRAVVGIEPSWEERTRGGDGNADWVLLINGSELAAIQTAIKMAGGPALMEAQGASNVIVGEYGLRLTVHESEMRKRV